MATPDSYFTVQVLYHPRFNFLFPVFRKSALEHKTLKRLAVDTTVSPGQIDRDAGGDYLHHHSPRRHYHTPQSNKVRYPTSPYSLTRLPYHFTNPTSPDSLTRYDYPTTPQSSKVQFPTVLTRYNSPTTPYSLTVCGYLQSNNVQLSYLAP